MFMIQNHNFSASLQLHPDLTVRPRFTDAKIKSFMVVRAGNSARFNINFEVIKDQDNGLKKTNVHPENIAELTTGCLN